jgi:hypothetical protein
MHTVHLISIHNPQIEGKFTKTPGGLTNIVAKTSLLSELVLPIIKYAIAPLEVGPEFALNWEVG